MSADVDAIVNRISSKAKTDGGSGNDDAGMKPGDHGRRILAAIKANDPEGIEEAIKDCVDDYGPDSNDSTGINE